MYWWISRCLSSYYYVSIQKSVADRRAIKLASPASMDRNFHSVAYSSSGVSFLYLLNEKHR